MLQFTRIRLVAPSLVIPASVDGHLERSNSENPKVPSMINRPVHDIKKDDIENLVRNQVPESKTLEYKEELPGGADRDKKEFLADVSSFANASGGDILFGVKAQRDISGRPTGIPEAATGVSIANADAEFRRLESLIQFGIAPRIAGLQLAHIAGFPNGPIILLRVPRSWAAPHMVTFKATSRFYSRNSAGKKALDVSEIRSAFALSEALPEKVRRFRDERVGRIIADETPVPLEPGAKIVLHLLPAQAVDPATMVDLSGLRSQTVSLQPFDAGGWDHRYNLDGFLTYAGQRDSESSYAYLQIFRNGAIEAAGAMRTEHQGKRFIASSGIEKTLIQQLGRCLEVEKALGIGPPIFAMVTLLDVKGCVLMVPNRISYLGESRHKIDRDTLYLPDVMVDDINIQPDAALRPAFDALWQAGGFPRCGNYDESGKWVGGS